MATKKKSKSKAHEVILTKTLKFEGKYIPVDGKPVALPKELAAYLVNIEAAEDPKTETEEE